MIEKIRKRRTFNILCFLYKYYKKNVLINYHNIFIFCKSCSYSKNSLPLHYILYVYTKYI